MNKKKQNKKTSNPRRIKKYVYQMSKPTPREIALAALSNLDLSSPPPAESICDKARRLANEAEETKKKERTERELAFMKRMFETEDLAGAGVVMDKVREDGTIEYLICGRRWVYTDSGLLANIDNYLGIQLGANYTCRLLSFGESLKRLDKREAELRAKYPDNWWGWLKAWWHQFSIF